MPPLAGIVHAAGVKDDGALAQQTWARFAAVLAPKVSGAWNLHEQTRDLPLDFFVLFSSAASVLGSGGQTNYSAANAFLDALAHHRRASGLPGLSINWGPWAEGGMATSLDQRGRRRWEDAGVSLIAPEQGVDVLDLVVPGRSAQVAVLPVDWRRFLKRFEPGHEPGCSPALPPGLPGRQGPPRRRRGRPRLNSWVCSRASRTRTVSGRLPSTSPRRPWPCSASLRRTPSLRTRGCAISGSTR